MKICDEIPDHPLIIGLESPDDTYKGITYACTIEDAKKTIDEIPELDVVGLLTTSGTGSRTLNSNLIYFTSMLIIFLTLKNKPN